MQVREFVKPIITSAACDNTESSIFTGECVADGGNVYVLKEVSAFALIRRKDGEQWWIRRRYLRGDQA